MAYREENNFIPNRRCIVCGRVLELSDKPLCNWCGDEKLYRVLSSTVDLIDSEVSKSERIDVEGNNLFSLVADIGMFSNQHPLLAMHRKIISLIITGIGKGITNIEIDKLWDVAGLRRVQDFLNLLEGYGLINIDNENGRITIPSDSIFHKVYSELETRPRFNRSAAFVLGYVTLKAMRETIEKIKAKGKLLCGEGITKLYSITIGKNGNVDVRIPKSYTATLSFVFGSWAREWEEISELELHKFLSSCGITGRMYRGILSFLTGATPVVHGLYKSFQPDLLGKITIYRFKISDEYLRVREMVYERMRERERRAGTE